MWMPQREKIEPADRSVRFYERVLRLVAVLVIGAVLGTRADLGTNILPIILGAIALLVDALMVGVSLWMLLLPSPRFSVYRSVNVAVGLLAVVYYFVA